MPMFDSCLQVFKVESERLSKKNCWKWEIKRVLLKDLHVIELFNMIKEINQV